MGRLKKSLLLPLLGVSLVLISCETAEQKHVAVAPPVRATAPTLTSASPASQRSRQFRKNSSSEPTRLQIW